MSDEYMMTYWTSKDREQAADALVAAASFLTAQGFGKTHYALRERVQDAWVINVYKRRPHVCTILLASAPPWSVVNGQSDEVLLSVMDVARGAYYREMVSA